MGDCTCKSGCQTCVTTTQKKRRNTAEIINRTDNLSWTGGSHKNRVISAYFPVCFTFEECDYYLQRFMTPTKEAFEGKGNGMTAGGTQPKWKEDGWVEMWPIPVDIGIEEAKIGYVTITRSSGKLVNTTQKPHPFIGTITVTLQKDGDGFYVEVVGEGQEGKTPPNQSWDPAPVSTANAHGLEWAGDEVWNGYAWLFSAHPIDNMRNVVNTALGPILFQNLCNIMINASYVAKREACGSMPATYNTSGLPSTSSIGQLWRAL